MSGSILRMPDDKLTLLIDGDIIAYKVACACEHAIEWSEGVWTLHSDLKEAKALFQEQYEQIRDKITADDVVFALSPKRNFRYRIWPEYKANRKGRRRPLVWEQLKTWIEEEYKTFQRPDIEADDVLGILATSPYIIPGDKIIVSTDKDFKTVPARFCNIRDWEVRETTEEQADYNHMLQTLTGDSCDGYKGCPDCGPVKARKVLDGLSSYQEMWPAVVEAYAKKGLGEEYALVMARLARICRRGDYDFKRKEVILWAPYGEEGSHAH